MLVRRFLLSLFILTSLIGTAGCRGSALRADDYRSRPFRAEVEGMLGGISFGAQIGYDGREREITYLSPEALSGITLRETGEGVRIEADGQTAEIPAEAVAVLPKNALYLELASSSGIDVSAAQQRGIRIEPALGLPGKHAPETAGAALAQALQTLFAQEGILP